MKITGLCLSRGDQDMLLAAMKNWDEQKIAARKDFVVVTDEESFKTLRIPGNRTRVLAVPSDMNLGARRNLALRFAQGDIVATWDDDDWSAPNRLATQCAALTEQNRASFLQHVTLEHGERRGKCPMLSGWPQTMVAHRTAVLECGGYPETESFDGDTDLCMELQGRAGGVVLPNEVELYRYRQHQNNVTGAGHWDSLWDMVDRGVRKLSE
jgi:glycosyltransferase involved in cell wall biosynthesis